jgi:hypothetical protein
VNSRFQTFQMLEISLVDLNTLIIISIVFTLQRHCPRRLENEYFAQSMYLKIFSLDLKIESFQLTPYYLVWNNRFSQVQSDRRGSKFIPTSCGMSKDYPIVVFHLILMLYLKSIRVIYSSGFLINNKKQ